MRARRAIYRRQITIMPYERHARQRRHHMRITAALLPLPSCAYVMRRGRRR